MRSILIVDDALAILPMLRAVFSGAGYEVTTASDGESAIRCLAKCFDVVLTDVDLPGMTGCDLARWVAAHYPTTHMVLMSGYQLQCGNCPYSPPCTLVRKPFRVDEIVAAVERAEMPSGT